MTRREAIQARRTLQNRKEKEQAIRKKLAPFVKGKRTAAYYPVNGEADIYTGHETEYYLPKTNPDCTLDFGRDKVAPGWMHIPEPAAGWISLNDLDVILVPVVQFQGTHRQGYGKGCYDRTLRHFHGLAIGIAFEVQEGTFPIHEWDVPLDMVITEHRIIWRKYNET